MGDHREIALHTLIGVRVDLHRNTAKKRVLPGLVQLHIFFIADFMQFHVHTDPELD